MSSVRSVVAIPVQSSDGVTYVGVEPVGPAKSLLGEVSGKAGWHLFWGSAQDRALPAAQ